MERDSNTVVAAFTEEHVERLTGVTKRQLRYWAKEPDRFYIPSIKFEGDGFADLRLYSFRDLVCLKVLNALRNGSKIQLKELREVKERLAHLGDDMWAKTTLYILGKKVVFDNPETGEKEEATSGQGVLQIPLKVVTGDMQVAVKAMRMRDKLSYGQINQRRGVAQNQLVISGTRIPIRAIKEFSTAGYSVRQILKEYPTLAESDIVAAIEYKEVA